MVDPRWFVKFFFFFFQAEDGIRDWSVTGVQTCALPISAGVAQGDRVDRAGGCDPGVAANEPALSAGCAGAAGGIGGAVEDEDAAVDCEECGVDLDALGKPSGYSESEESCQ